MVSDLSPSDWLFLKTIALILANMLLGHSQILLFVKISSQLQNEKLKDPAIAPPWRLIGWNNVHH